MEKYFVPLFLYDITILDCSNMVLSLNIVLKVVEALGAQNSFVFNKNFKNKGALYPICALKKNYMVI
jgi:hypothetical protein